MKEDEVCSLFANLTVWTRGKERAPHKPLLALYAIGRCLRGEPRFVPYSEIDRDLKSLLLEFGPARKSYHPEYPFWRLQNDGIWELHGAEGLQSRKSNTDAKKSELLQNDVHGGFPEPIFEYLSAKPSVVLNIVRNLLDANFPASIHDDILTAVGINLESSSPAPQIRDPQFREIVLRAYEYSCAVCGFDIRLSGHHIALEAAHIKWHQAGGPSTEANGLALCTLHHKLFDRGAFTLSESYRVTVSEHAHGTSGFNEWLMAFHGKPIRSPQRPTYVADTQFINWHVREVFRGPSRYTEDVALSV